MKSAAELAAEQLAAYNAKDLDAFCACYSDDVQVYLMPSHVPKIEGIIQFRENYIKTFENPSIHAIVNTRIPMGKKCMDHEICFKYPDKPPLEIIIIYEEKQDKIHRVTMFFRDDSSL